MIENIIQQFILIIVLTFSVVMHECSHAYSAYLLGDYTAKYQRRLSFNPIRHIEPRYAAIVSIGIIIGGILPQLSFISDIMIFIGFFSLARPVPINPGNFSDPKKGMAITALCGPLSNIILAFICMVILVALPNLNSLYYIGIILYTIIYLNLRLAVFNLFPIPPLDGSKVLFAFLPQSIYFTILQYERYIMIGLIILVYGGHLNSLINVGTNNLFGMLETAARFILGKG